MFNNKNTKENFQVILNNLNQLQEVFNHINTTKKSLAQEVLGIKTAVSTVEDAFVGVYLSLLKKENPNNIEFKIQKRSDIVNLLKESGLEDRIIYNNKDETITFNLNYEEATKIRSTIIRRFNIEKGDLQVNYLIENNGELNKLEIKKVNGSATEFQSNILEVERLYLLDRNFEKKNPINKNIEGIDCLNVSVLFKEIIQSVKEILNKQNMTALIKLEQSSNKLESGLKSLYDAAIVDNKEANILISVENRIDIKRELEKLNGVFNIKFVNNIDNNEMLLITPREENNETIYVNIKGESLEILLTKEQAIRMRSQLQSACNLSNKDIQAFYIVENEDVVYKVKLKDSIKSGADFDKNILDIQRSLIETYGNILSGNLNKLDWNISVITKPIEIEQQQKSKLTKKMV